MTNGDIKSVQGDTGHAEAEMVMDVYSRVIDEDRRLNAKKLDEQFYNKLDESVNDSNESAKTNKDTFFANLMEFMSDESNREQLQQMMNLANK